MAEQAKPENQAPAFDMALAAGDPDKLYELAGRVAKAAQKIIEEHKLYQEIVFRGKTRRHLYLEAWELVGVPLGLFAKVVEAYEIEGGAMARAVVVRADGTEIGGGVGMCTRDEVRNGKRWWDRKNRQELLSMAETRALSKAYNSVIRWVPKMFGYDSTPAEEVGDDGEPSPVERARGGASQQGAPQTPPRGARAGEPQGRRPAPDSVRQQVYGQLGIVGFRSDQEKKDAFWNFLPAHKGKSSREVPEEELRNLVSALMGVNSGENDLAPQGDGGALAIVRKSDGAVLYPAQAGRAEQPAQQQPGGAPPDAF